LDGRVAQVAYLGPVRRYRIVIADGTELRVTQSADEQAQSGDVRVSVAASGVVALAAD